MMQSREFLRYFIPDRIRLVYELKDPTLIYVLLEKHLLTSIEELKRKYQITLHYQRQEITIQSTRSDIAELFEYLERFNLNVLSITQTSLVYNIDDFIRKIY